MIIDGLSVFAQVGQQLLLFQSAFISSLKPYPLADVPSERLSSLVLETVSRYTPPGFDWKATLLLWPSPHFTRNKDD